MINNPKVLAATYNPTSGTKMISFLVSRKKIMEIKEIVADHFDKLTLGRTSHLYSTEDNKVFLKYDCALDHSLASSLGVNNIYKWYYQLGVREVIDNDVVRSRVLRSERLWFTNDNDEKCVPDRDTCIVTLEVLIETNSKEFVSSKFTVTEVLEYITLLLKYDKISDERS